MGKRIKQFLFSIITFIFVFLLVPKPLSAQIVCPGIQDIFGIKPIGGNQEITVSNSAVALTIPTTQGGNPVTVRFAVVSVKSNAIVTLDNGSTPTASNGLLWQPNEKFLVCQSSLAAFKAIRAGAVDAVIGVSYFGT